MASGENGVVAVVDGMTPTTNTEKFNQLIRGVVVLLLTIGFIYGFVISKVVSTESFAIVMGIAMTWWFKSSDAKDEAARSKPAPTGATTGGSA